MKSDRLRIADGFPGERLTILPEDVVRRARRLPVCRDLCVTHLGRFDHVTGHYISRPKGRPEHVLLVCLAGKGRVRIDQTLFHLHKGHGILLPPHISHQYEADVDDPWSLFWFHFSGERARDFVRILTPETESPRFWVQDIDPLQDAFEECHRYVLGGYTNAELIGLSTAFARLLGFGLTLRRSPSRQRRQTESRVFRALEFMRRNLDRPLSVQELANHAGLSVPHFAAMFKRQLNVSPADFHIRLRLQRACELLEARDHTIAEIAHALGYEDPLYFSRLFSRKLGISPRDFRAGQSRRLRAGPMDFRTVP